MSHLTQGGQFNILFQLFAKATLISDVKSSHHYLYSLFTMQIVSKQLYSIKKGNSVQFSSGQMRPAV